jgi:NADH-quinone oxidoreductase subunit M
MAPLLGLIVFLGVYPKPVLERIEPSVKALVAHIEDHSDFEEPEVDKTGREARESTYTEAEEHETEGGHGAEEGEG